MKRCTYVCLVVGLILLVAPASALTPDQINISTSADWVTAGSSAQATITVQAYNSSNPLIGATVEFAVDSRYGSISPASTTTDGSGIATTTFTVGTVSGMAPIAVRVTSAEGETGEEVFDQQIDHAAPYRVANIWYNSSVPVGETTNITVRMVDRYGNLVDGRRTAETVYFMVGSPGGNAVFSSSGTDEATVPADAAGNVTATLRVDTLPGENVVWVKPPTPLADSYLTIRGVSNLEPCSINLVVQPGGDPPSVDADGTSRFYLTYTLYDRYGNPTAGRQVRIVTNIPGEESLLTTNTNGQVLLSYGPRKMIGEVTITATAVDNASVTRSQLLAFVSNDPVNMLVSANPFSIPSRDVPTWTPIVVTAKVVDQNGNPVPGETVEFSIENVNVGSYNQTIAPDFTNGLTTITATTNAFGSADVEFRPGGFTTDFMVPDYSQNAAGTCDVVATWNGMNRSVELTWKNYPYLSVSTSIDPELVQVNETVDVTIRLTGDGWALKPDPIDVILCMDRAESMLKENPDRMVNTRAGAKAFVGSMTNNWDRLAVLSFGLNGTASQSALKDKKVIGDDGINTDEETYAAVHYPDLLVGKTYSSHATIDMPLTADFEIAANDTLDNVTPSGCNPLRYAAYKGITELKNNGRSWAVKALVILVDGDYDWYGDPLAAAGADLSHKDPELFGQRTNNWYPMPGITAAEQDMRVYAVNNDVRIYTISYSSDVSNDCNETMRIFAEATGGKNYRANTAEDLVRVYTDIAGELKTEAGVNTNMEISFENVTVDSAPVSGDQVFDYVYEPGVSTYISSWNSTATIIAPHTRDDTDAWIANQTLRFDIGTVTLGQIWETTFRLKVLKEGTIDVFGSGATITFNDADTLTLPRIYVTAIGEQNSTLDTGILDVYDAHYTSSPPVFDLLSVAWNLNYTGVQRSDVDISYSRDGGFSWMNFATRSVGNGTTSMTSNLDVRNFPPGEYMIRIYATAPDTADDWEDLPGIQVGDEQRAYIQLS